MKKLATVKPESDICSLAVCNYNMFVTMTHRQNTEGKFVLLSRFQGKYISSSETSNHRSMCKKKPLPVIFIHCTCGLLDFLVM